MGEFLIDRQTRADLQLLDDHSDSVFACFNQTITHGGEDALRDLFRKPLSNHKALAGRVSCIRVSGTGQPLADVCT